MVSIECHCIICENSQNHFLYNSWKNNQWSYDGNIKYIDYINFLILHKEIIINIPSIKCFACDHSQECNYFGCEFYQCCYQELT